MLTNSKVLTSFTSKLFCHQFKYNKAQNVLMRSYSAVHNVHYKKWKKPKKEKYIIDPANFKVGEPVSGSVLHGNLAETYNSPYELQLSELTRNGFMRFQKGYKPPEDAEAQLVLLIKTIHPELKETTTPSLNSFKLDNKTLKFEFLNAAFEEFKHSVPNSMLHMMETFGDVIQFYKTPIETTTPYDDLVSSKDLPQNLHVQKEPLRFDPETDTLFGGVTAFPKETAIVTGLRAKKKYRTQGQKLGWPYV